MDSKVEAADYRDTSKDVLRNSEDCFDYEQYSEYSEGDHPQAQYDEKRIINAVHSQIKPCLSRSVSFVDPRNFSRAIRTEIREAVGSLRTAIEEALENAPTKKYTADDSRKLDFRYDELVKLVTDMRMDHATQLEQSEKLVQKMWLKVAGQERQCQNLKNFVEKILHSSPSITPNSKSILDSTKNSKSQRKELIKTPQQDLDLGHSEKSVGQQTDYDGIKLPWLDWEVAVENPPCKAVRAQKGSQRITDSNKSSNPCYGITALPQHCRSDSRHGTGLITGCLKYDTLNPTMIESKFLFQEPDDAYLNVEDLLQAETSKDVMRNREDCFDYEQYSEYSEGDHPQAQYDEKRIIKPCLSPSVSDIDPYSLVRAIRTEIREAVGSIKTLIEESFENAPAKKQTTDDARKLDLIYDEFTKLVTDMRRDYASQHQKFKKRIEKLSLKVVEERLKDLVEKILNSSISIPPNSKSAHAKRLPTSKESTGNYIIDTYVSSFESHKQAHSQRLLTSEYLEGSARNYIDNYLLSFESRLGANKWKPHTDRQFPCGHNRELIKKPNADSEIGHSESFVSSQKTYFDGINLPWLIWEVDLDDPPHSESAVSSQRIYLDGTKLPWLVWEVDLDDPPCTVTVQAQEDSQRFTDSNNNNYFDEISALSEHFGSDSSENNSMYGTDLITSGLKYDTLNRTSIESINLFQEPDDSYMKSEDLLKERMCKTRVESGSLILCTGKLCFF